MSVAKITRITLMVVYTDGGKTRTIVTPSGRQYQIASEGYPTASSMLPIDTLCRLLCEAEETS